MNNITGENKINMVMQRIKEKVDISPVNSLIEYRAGWEIPLSADDEIMILNKLEEDGLIEIVENYSNEFM